MENLRVFLDTSVVGGYLRRQPNRLNNFREVQSFGVRYYASTDVISEIYCNPDEATFKVQLGILRSLVDDGCFYRAPIGMIRADIHKLQGRPLITLLEPPLEVSSKITSLTRMHSSEAIRKIRARLAAEKKQFFNDDRAATRKVLEVRESGGYLPDSLGEFTRQAREIEAVHPVEHIASALGCTLEDDDWKKLAKNAKDYRALYVYAVICRLIPFSRASKLSKPDKGDTIDVRHTVASSYCQAFITDDRNLRALIKPSAKLLPYKVYSPEEFLDVGASN